MRDMKIYMFLFLFPVTMDNKKVRKGRTILTIKPYKQRNKQKAMTMSNRSISEEITRTKEGIEGKWEVKIKSERKPEKISLAERQRERTKKPMKKKQQLGR